MVTVRLIYFSEAAPGIGTADLKKIMGSSMARNRENAICGILFLHGRHFLQALEGPREQVTATFARILSDPRHRNVTLMSCVEIPAPTMAGWSMALLGSDDETKRVLAGAGVPAPLKFQNFTTDCATAVVLALRTLLAAGGRAA